jgi:tRNA(adenine34) deaminase
MILVENLHQPLNGNDKHHYYMGYALQIATQSLAFDEVPVGCVIVCNVSERIIAMTHNKTISLNQTYAHAEMLAIEEACIFFNNYRLPNCRIYVTLEPCAMCAGAIIHGRFSHLIFGASDLKTGAAGSVTNLFNMPFNHHTQIISGINVCESKELLQNFFRKKRQCKIS